MTTDAAQTQLSRHKNWAEAARLLHELLVYGKASTSLQRAEQMFGTTLSGSSQVHALAGGATAQVSSGTSLTPDPDFPLVGSAGISGHRTVAKEVTTDPPESASTPSSTSSPRPTATATATPVAASWPRAETDMQTSTMNAPLEPEPEAGPVFEPLERIGEHRFMEGFGSGQFFLAPEGYERAIEDWWELGL